MSQYYLTIIFAVISLTGLGLIIYGSMLKREEQPESIESEEVLAFSDSGESADRLFDDMGYEGLQHKEKEAFNPEKHRPEPLESRKKPA